MDFGKIVATDLPEAGSWLHLADPATGKPLYRTDKNAITTEETPHPCRVKVRGNRSPQVKRVIDEGARRDELHAMRVMRASDRDVERLMADNAKARADHQKALLIATVSEMENVVLHEGEKPAPCTPENVAAALSHPQFMIQIFRHSADETALFRDAPTG